MLRSIIEIIATTLICITIVGCAGQIKWPGTQVKLDPVFWENKNATIALVVMPNPIEGHIYRFDVKYPGSTTIMDHPGDTDDLAQFVQKYDYSEIESIKKLFSDDLTKRGVRVLSFDDKALTAISHELRNKKVSDSEAITILRRQTDAEYIISFAVSMCGVKEQIILPGDRKYSGIISITSRLIDLRKGEIKWEYYTAIKEVNVSSDWNQPPAYPNIAKAMHQVTTSTIKELQESFFK